MPGCREDVASDSTRRSAGSGPPSQYPIARPASTDTENARMVPSPINDKISRAETNNTGNTLPIRRTVDITAIGLIHRLDSSGANVRRATPAESGKSSLLRTNHKAELTGNRSGRPVST